MNYDRHIDIFDPALFDERVDVVGCGAVGSRIAISLAKLGIRKLHLWDFDTVEAHNVANQTFGIRDVGKLKVDALEEQIKYLTGSFVEKHPVPATGKDTFGDVVFIVTDTMSSRRDVYSSVRKRAKLVIECRMATASLRVYSIIPRIHNKEYLDSYYDDDENDIDACDRVTSAGPTAEIISGLAVWQLIRWNATVRGWDDDLENELILSLRPTMLINNIYGG